MKLRVKNLKRELETFFGNKDQRAMLFTVDLYEALYIKATKDEPNFGYTEFIFVGPEGIYDIIKYSAARKPSTVVSYINKVLDRWGNENPATTYKEATYGH